MTLIDFSCVIHPEFICFATFRPYACRTRVLLREIFAKAPVHTERVAWRHLDARQFAPENQKKMISTPRDANATRRYVATLRDATRSV